MYGLPQKHNFCSCLIVLPIVHANTSPSLFKLHMPTNDKAYKKPDTNLFATCLQKEKGKIMQLVSQLGYKTKCGKAAKKGIRSI